MLSDDTFGQLVTIYCSYDSNTDTVTASKYERSDGSTGNLDVSINLAESLERWRVLDEHLRNNTVPAGEYKYKYELTNDLLREIPDAKLKSIAEGNLIFGDWQPVYSRYKNLQLEMDKINPERTDGERALARAEYRRRHPRSKI